MKLVFAPDSFKGSLRSAEMTEILSEEAAKVFPEAELVCIPIADGGEGTVEALIASCGGTLESAMTLGPDGAPVQAVYGLMDGGTTAVVEMAQASGLPLAGEDANPMMASSFGTGLLIRQCLELGVSKLYVGLGGSATNDGGMGMLTALGARFLDARGNILTGSGSELKLIDRIELDGLMPEIFTTEIHVIADVNNPLLGETGATYVYGPQKGATDMMLLQLEEGMKHYANMLEAAIKRYADSLNIITGRDIRHEPGVGAAGGMGAALYGVMNGTLCAGIDAMLETVRFAERVQGADLLITGEGRLDEHSIVYGKICGMIAARCAQAGIPVIALVGSMGPGAAALYEIGQTSIMTVVNEPMTVKQAIENARDLYRDAASRMFRMLRMGQGMKEILNS